MPVLHFDITHTTVYRYKEPVSFGLHRVMFRPRESHDLRVLATDLQVSPEASIRMIQDPNSNSVALVQPLGSATELRFVCTFRIEHVPSAPDALLEIDPTAEYIPFAYSLQDRYDLERYLRPHHDDPEGVLIRWAQQFLQGDQESKRTRDVLTRMNAHIGRTLKYEVRNEEGTQSPLETLERGSGTCRDYALLMMEAARRLGIAARFVSGYLYDSALDPSKTAEGKQTPVSGAGATHAWMQAYLPGAGWIAFDPTNNIMGSGQLVRVAVARDPAFASPLSGSWYGEADAYLGMEASVEVRRIDLAPPSASAAVKPG
ncbi:transglutaminase family protein [Variovorax sp. OV329]|uniref:transglutaminase family protein n=1 Tax=Variovorax sp. OV329 TaxID=1882825 RepID=UPI0008E15707|nr:transglutaminase family protein [Variovorax sp. OV329]SFN12233.1 Transglutaminase-like enzyme, putative cysteine protease [Variovorax sp. OV329]